MALMAVLRFSSRFMASTLLFWTKKRMSKSAAKAQTTSSSGTVKAFLIEVRFIRLL